MPVKVNQEDKEDICGSAGYSNASQRSDPAEKGKVLLLSNKLIFILALLCCLVYACSTSNSNSNHRQNDTGGINAISINKSHKSINCDSVWRSLIFHSNFQALSKADTLDYRILDGDITDTSILIKIVAILDKTELPDGWIKIDLKTKTVWDVTLEDSIRELKVDTSLLEVVLKHCSKREQLFKKSKG